MLSRIPGRAARVAAGLCAVKLAVAAPAIAQQAGRPAPPIPPEQKVGKSADPHNLEGVWFTRGYDRTYRQLDRSEPPFLPAARTEWLRHIQAEKDGSPIGDAPTRCYPHGVPRIVASPYPIQIVQTPGLLTILHEVGHNIRYVHMDQEHPKDVKRSFLGHSVGHWDGDTLVVDTVGFNGYNDLTTLDRAGLPKSADFKLTEKYHLINGGKQLEATFTIEDPKYYTKAWSARQVFDRQDPNTEFAEYVCTDKNPEATMQ
jgi:hypothetical protein